MNLYRIIAEIASAIAAGEERQELAVSEVGRIEAMLTSIGIVGDELYGGILSVQRALYCLRVRTAYGDGTSTAAAYVHVQDMWKRLEPGLCDFAAKAK
jgi:hypothetical protein